MNDDAEVLTQNEKANWYWRGALITATFVVVFRFTGFDTSGMVAVMCVYISAVISFVLHDGPAWWRWWWEANEEDLS